MINRLKGNQRGITLTEVIIAMAIFAVVGSSVMFALNSSSKTIIKAHEITTAESLTRTIIEYIKRSDYDYSVSTTDLNELVEIDDEDDEIEVDDTTGFPASGVIQIEEELIYYASLDGNSFNDCIRGYAGTTAAEHANNTAVIDSPLYYYAPDINICQAAGVNLADDPYYGDYTVETGILRLECQYPDDDATPYSDDDGLQKIYVLVRYQGLEALTTESYKVNR